MPCTHSQVCAQHQLYEGTIERTVEKVCLAKLSPLGTDQVPGDASVCEHFCHAILVYHIEQNKTKPQKSQGRSMLTNIKPLQRGQTF